jgi:hypothetical protein
LAKTKLVPDFAKSSKSQKSIRQWASDNEMARDLFRGLAALPGATGPDLIYSIYANSKGDTADLALAMLYSKDLKAKASPALAALLDLRKEENCEAASKLVEQLKDVGDSRSLMTLSRINMTKTGCGEKKNEDCFRCLRLGSLLKDAMIAVQRRPGP